VVRHRQNTRVAVLGDMLDLSGDSIGPAGARSSVSDGVSDLCPPASSTSAAVLYVDVEVPALEVGGVSEVDPEGSHGDDGDGGIGQAGAAVLSRCSRTQPALMAVSVLSVVAGSATGWWPSPSGVLPQPFVFFSEASSLR